MTGASVGALRSVPLVLFAVGALLTWRIGIERRRTICAARRRRLLGLVRVRRLEVHPSSWLLRRGLVLGLAVVLLALRLDEQPTRRDWSLLGLALGLGWWATPQVFVGRPPGRRLAHLATSSPAPIRVDCDRGSGRRRASLARGERQERLAFARHAAARRLPRRQRPQPPRRQRCRPRSARACRSPLSGSAVPSWAVVLRDRPHGDRLDAVRQRARLGPIVPVLVAFPVFYALSPYSWFNVEPRYLVLLGPLLALVVVAAGGTAGRGAAIACALALISAVGVALLERRDVASATRTESPFLRASIRCCGR